MALTPETIPIIFYLTCFIVGVKIFMLIFIALKISKRKDENIQIAILFMRSMAFLIFCLLVSRILYMVFDFYFTGFDVNLYPTYQWWWKSAQLVVSIGFAYIVFVVDKKLLDFKLKGVIAYLVIAGGVLTLIYPVATVEDFGTLSTISIIPQLGLLMLFIVFVNIARKTSGRLRKTALIIIFAFVFYTIAALVVNAGLLGALNDLFGTSMDVYMYLLQAGLKTVGVVFMAWGASRWGT